MNQHVMFAISLPKRLHFIPFHFISPLLSLQSEVSVCFVSPVLAQRGVCIEEGAANQYDGTIFGQIVLDLVMELIKEGSVHITFSRSQSANDTAIDWVISMEPPLGVMRTDTTIRSHVRILISRSIEGEWMIVLTPLTINGLGMLLC